MLKFIVLGQIPGTTIELNFTQLLLAASLFLAICTLAARIYWSWKKSDPSHRLPGIKTIAAAAGTIVNRSASYLHKALAHRV